MFRIENSKLYTQIMDAAVRFFGLDKEAATEAEVHDALESAESLAEQLSKAKAEALRDLQKLSGLETKISSLETKLYELEGQISEKDSRIVELQMQLAEVKAASEDALNKLNAQHAAEVENLAGQIAKLKAGRIQEQSEGGGDTIPETAKTAAGAKILTIKDEALKSLVKKARQN